jgi:hypothetical protein
MIEKYSKIMQDPAWIAFASMAERFNQVALRLDTGKPSSMEVFSTHLNEAVSPLKMVTPSPKVAAIFKKAANRAAAQLTLAAQTYGMGPFGAQHHWCGAMRADLQRLATDLYLQLAVEIE